MEELVLGSEHAGKVTFHSRRFDETHWLESYSLDLEAPDFRAAVLVENPPYGHPPSALFRDLAREWSGWKGEKSWCAMEGEFTIAATTDTTGHVTFEFKLPRASMATGWTGTLWLLVEAGQLEQLASAARVFFDERDPAP